MKARSFKVIGYSATGRAKATAVRSSNVSVLTISSILLLLQGTCMTGILRRSSEVNSAGTSLVCLEEKQLEWRRTVGELETFVANY